MTAGDALASALERLPAVLAATILPGPDSRRRVYLAVSPDADRERLREVVTGLFSDHGLDCPPDRIHIAAPPPPAGGELPRLHLEGLEVRRTENAVECEVTLRGPSRSSVATAREPDSPRGRARAAARAALAAAERLDPDLRLGLEGIMLVDLFGREAVTVLVEGALGRALGHLPGAALVERSAEEAACRAVLAALRGWPL